MRHVEQVADAADGTPLKNQMCETGTASSMWPSRSRRTLACVTSTPQRSQIDAAVADALVLAAVALPVLDRAEDPLAEQAVLLRLERAVVDGLRLGHLAVRPLRIISGEASRMRIELNVPAPRFAVLDAGQAELADRPHERAASGGQSCMGRPRAPEAAAVAAAARTGI